MDGNYLTAGDLALIENRRGYGYGNGDCGYYRHGSKSMAATGIGLAAGLGGGALLLAIAGIWGINQASKARARGMENINMENNSSDRSVDAKSLSRLIETCTVYSWFLISKEPVVYKIFKSPSMK